MYARITELRSSSRAELDADLEVFDSEIWPRAEAMPGSMGSIVLVDREHGRGTLITLWDSESAMADSRELAAHLREIAAQRMNLDAVPTVCETEVARFAVPESLPSLV